MLDGAVVLLGLEVVDGHLLERVDGRLDDRLREEQHLPQHGRRGASWVARHARRWLGERRRDRLGRRR